MVRTGEGVSESISRTGKAFRGSMDRIRLYTYILHSVSRHLRIIYHCFTNYFAPRLSFQVEVENGQASDPNV